LGRVSDPISVLCLLFYDTDTTELAKRWKLSKKELRQMYFLNTHIPFVLSCNSQQIIALGNYLKTLCLATDRENVLELAKVSQIPIEGWVGSLKIPEFEITGADLLDKGMTPGIELGKMLTCLKAEWMVSNFTLTKKQLLASIDARI
jgi:hypothetical protein